MNKYLSRTAKRALFLVGALVVVCLFLPAGTWRLMLPLCGIMLALVGGSVLLQWRQHRPARELEEKSAAITLQVEDESDENPDRLE